MKCYCYFVESTDKDRVKDHSKLFKMIRDLDISDDKIFTDTGEDKTALNRLLEDIEDKDFLLIHSILDFDEESSKGLLKVLEILECKRVTIHSIEEPFLHGVECYSALRGFGRINAHYLEKARQKGYKRAKKDGRLGRPRKEVDKAVRLYNTKSFSVEEITVMCGISSSTLYRALKEAKEHK